MSEFKISNEKDFIPFCDHSIDLYRIGYLKHDKKVYNDFYQANPIAEAFKDIFTLIKEDSKLLY